MDNDIDTKTKTRHSSPVMELGVVGKPQENGTKLQGTSSYTTQS